MSLAHEFRPAANADVVDAYHWYEAQQPGRGDEFLVELQERVAAICASPTSYGRVRGQMRAAPFQHSRYILYYRVDTSLVVILAVQDERADPRRWQGRR